MYIYTNTHTHIYNDFKILKKKYLVLQTSGSQTFWYHIVEDNLFMDQDSGGGGWGVVDVSRVIGEGNGTPLQYSCLENPMDRGTW